VQVGVMPVDWARFFAKIPAGAEPPWLSLLAREARAEAPAVGRSELLEQLEKVTAGERIEVLTTFVRERAASVLGVDPSTGPDLRRPLNELGLDSLMAVELCNTLGRAIGHHLPPTLLFDYPTLDSLIRHIASDVLLIGTEEPREEAAPDDALRSQTLAEVEGLSEEEMNALVAQELAKLVP
jgi:acyl carrier protein